MEKGLWDRTASKSQHAQELVRCALEIKLASHGFCELVEKGRYLHAYPHVRAYVYEKKSVCNSCVHTYAY